MFQTFLQEKFVGREGQVLKFNSQGVLEAVDITIQSIKPQIVVYAESGSTVTCNRQGVVLTATEDSGKWVFNLPNIGNWECIAINSLGDIGTNIVEVTEIKQYVTEITIGDHIDYILENNSWATIGSLASASLARNYWHIGDTKAIILNGTPNVTTWIEFVNYKVYATIIGFDHNSELEGIGLIHFQVGGYKDNSSTRICFIDEHYSTTGENAYNSCFVMNPRSTADVPVAWSDCRMRTFNCVKFKNCLPADLKEVLGTAFKYTDNSKSMNSSIYNYTATKDTVFLLSKYEINGGSSYNESSWQEPYDYYTNTGSEYYYTRQGVQCSSTTSSITVDNVAWWLRTPGKSTAGSGDYYTFYAAGTSTDHSSIRCSSERSLGFSPAFVVGKTN